MNVCTKNIKINKKCGIMPPNFNRYHLRSCAFYSTADGPQTPRGKVSYITFQSWAKFQRATEFELEEKEVVKNAARRLSRVVDPDPVGFGISWPCRIRVKRCGPGSQTRSDIFDKQICIILSICTCRTLMFTYNGQLLPWPSFRLGS